MHKISYTSNSDISFYIHWPFCKSKCPYCDFNSHVRDKIDYDKFLSSYLNEIDYFKSLAKNKNVRSIFFGGGTPSLMNPKLVEQIINKISEISSININTEITLETNPSSYETSKFHDFKSAGINRISIGVQAFNNKDLKALGREHDIDQAIYAISNASKIFHNVSFDLIYARHNQSLQEWQNELQKASKYFQNHISLYQLTIEKGTQFYKRFKNKEIVLPSDDIASIMYEWTNDYLENMGLNRYEVSNYAKNGYECTHNLSYWEYKTYIGIGAGAHSRIINKNNVRALCMWHNPEKWLDVAYNNGAGIQSDYILSTNDSIIEAFIMGLRVRDGIDLQYLYTLFGKESILSILNLDSIKYYQDINMIEYDENNIKLTKKGIIFCNYILQNIINI